MSRNLAVPSAVARLRALRCAALVLTLLAAPACYAYIDPNTGGFIYQLLFPLIVAVAAGWRWARMAVSSAWRRLVNALTGRSAEAAKEQADGAPPESEDR